MSYKAVLFDLDGTLLPMDLDAFTKQYFGAIAKWLAPHGFEPNATVDAILRGSYAMVKNDGTRSNEQAFWEDFEGRMGKVDRALFDSFYREKAPALVATCEQDPRARLAVETARATGARVVLATNPMFPAVFTELRAARAGLDVSKLAMVTTYENSCRCKPNPAYYEDILKSLSLSPEECLMVGNDVEEDMVPAASLGMSTFLVTDWLINKKDRDISAYPNGDLDALISFLAIDKR